jgi:hypothetical protein
VNDYVDYTYNEVKASYTAKKKFSSGNTVEIEFFLEEADPFGPLSVQVALRSYAKRKQIDRPDFEFRETGRDALEPAIWATKCLLDFPPSIFSEPYWLHKDRIVYNIFWSNARRRDIYHKWLSRYGFYFDVFDGTKCLSKIFDR